MSPSAVRISLDWKGGSVADLTLPAGVRWGVEDLSVPPPFRRGPRGAPWFNDDEWSGVETPSWLAWISNKNRSALVWGATQDLARRDALSVVVPAVLRRAGFLDGHGAVIAPDAARPDAGVFVTGLSGAGKSSLTVASALGGARFLSDDSVALGLTAGHPRAWSRRWAISLSQEMHRELLPDSVGRLSDGKAVFDARETFPDGWADSLSVQAIIFLERADAAVQPRVLETTRTTTVKSADAYQRLLMGHPILAMDRGARPSFKVLRALADLPCYRMAGGRDLLDPRTACDTLSTLLPQ